MRPVVRQRYLSFLVFAALAGLWQLMSVIFPQELTKGVPLVPGWQVVFTTTFLSLSQYAQADQGFGTSEQPTALLAAMTLLNHSAITAARLLAGLTLGWIIGGLLALLVSWSVWARRLIAMPADFVRSLPLLAMIPLFQLWFGLGIVGQIAFVAYGVAVIAFAAVVNAVANVSPIYLDNARTFGVGRVEIYRTVILPSILPELRSAILLTLGTAWSAVIGAEFLTAQSGLGYIIVFSQQFGYLDRMFLIALCILVYASASFLIAERVLGALTGWMPSHRK